MTHLRPRGKGQRRKRRRQENCDTTHL